MIYFAHISEDGKREQTILSHLLGTAQRAYTFGDAFHAGAEAYFAGFLHDIGKYSDAFQNRLHGGSGCDHSTAGAKEALARHDPFAAFAIAGHHGGLPGMGFRGICSSYPTLTPRLTSAIPNYSHFLSEFTPPQTAIPTWVQDLSDIEYCRAFKQSFYIRMLFSCLVDADYLDTEEFMCGAPAPRGSTVSMQTLLNAFSDYVHARRWDVPCAEFTLNHIRQTVLSACSRAGCLSPGLFTLTVPTGGGKTASSMSFALRHAVENHLTRIIYVIPYTSIIEQNAAVFREMFGAEFVLEHHSNVFFQDTEDDAENASAKRRRLATENWDAPIIVTTAVQFFESLFAAKPSKCRKLHNIANSVVLFDEAQMLPTDYLRPCIAAITELVQNYRTSCVLCTATQPSLNELIHEFAPSMSLTELSPDLSQAQAVFQRVHFCQDGTLSDDLLAERLNQEAQVLCIVNSRRQAQALYHLLEEDGRYHLSTFMTSNHRRYVLGQIRERLQKGLTCRVISTSLIEAGVDIDFPTVYRAEAGLDSILQAAGRCNREGKAPAVSCAVHIFSSETPPPAIFHQQIEAARSALSIHPSPTSPGAVTAYFDILYHRKGDAGLDKNSILPLIEKGSDAVGRYPFPVVAERFKLIDSDTCTVYIPHTEIIPALDALRSGHANRNQLRALAQHAVSVYQNAFEALTDAGHLEVLDEFTAILRSETLYRQDTGLSVETTLADLFI